MESVLFLVGGEDAFFCVSPLLKKSFFVSEQKDTVFRTKNGNLPPFPFYFLKTVCFILITAIPSSRKALGGAFPKRGTFFGGIRKTGGAKMQKIHIKENKNI